MNKFVEILEHCASPFHKRIFQTNNETDYCVKSQPWYTDTCKYKKDIFYDCLNVFRADKTASNRLALVTARSDFKSTLRRSRYENNQQQTLNCT